MRRDEERAEPCADGGDAVGRPEGDDAEGLDRGEADGGAEEAEEPDGRAEACAGPRGLGARPAISGRAGGAGRARSKPKRATTCAKKKAKKQIRDEAQRT